jgi:hypothetical protein
LGPVGEKANHNMGNQFVFGIEQRLSQAFEANAIAGQLL